MKTLLGYALHSSERPRFYTYLADLLQNPLDNRHAVLAWALRMLIAMAQESECSGLTPRSNQSIKAMTGRGRKQRGKKWEH